MVDQAVQQWEDVVHGHGDLGAVQLQQVPQVPLAGRPCHAAETPSGHVACPDAPL